MSAFIDFSDNADVFTFVKCKQAEGAPVALIAVLGRRGGGIRDVGALMAVTDADVAGYVSNGCVDADVIFRARRCLENQRGEVSVYGEGSPFIDVKLPCGGRLDVLICPDPDPQAVRAVVDGLANRRPQRVTMTTDAIGVTEGVDQSPQRLGENSLVFTATPKMRVRIAGRGGEPLALARLALASDFHVLLQSPDEETLNIAASFGAQTQRLQTPGALPQLEDDQWTAFALMFHDRDWDVALLAQALAGEAFYIGALGSQTAHDARRGALLDAGMSHEMLGRISAPIGLIPKLRDSTSLAISVLAEIIAARSAR